MELMPSHNKQERLDIVYLNMAHELAKLSYATRRKVGALAVKNRHIIGEGINGTPPGDDNCCEYTDEDGNIVTKPNVIHAEANLIYKLVRDGCQPVDSASIYITLGPCIQCAYAIRSVGFGRVIYSEQYRDPAGVEYLKKNGIFVKKVDQ